MGKDGGNFLTPKAIANRIKAKGLQKLRYFCQMCQKQCRDENGFKCHCMSESHQRQMQLFATNPNTFMDTFSVEFEAGMMEIISRRARARIHANLVYQEYIAEREHVHMNSTMWETLTDFVIYLGRAGKCEVDQTDKGWFIQFVDRDPAKLAAQEARSKRVVSDLDAEERHTRELLRVAKRARDGGDDGAGSSAHGAEPPRELVREVDAAPLVLQLQPGAAAAGAAAGKRIAFAPSSVFALADEASAAPTAPAASAGGSSGAPKSAMAAIIEEETRRKAKAAAVAAAAAPPPPPLAPGARRHEDWLCCGIVVKVLNGTLGGGQYRKQKGVVRALAGKFVAQVEMLNGGDVLSLDQADLETVLPPVGGQLRVVNGPHRGARAKLLAIDEAKFCVSAELAEGPRKGEVVGGLEYEDVCKLHTAN
jgi:DNA/RNA-binding protein KIN17